MKDIYSEAMPEIANTESRKNKTVLTVAPDMSLRVEHLNVHIDHAHILKDINLVIPEKSITCIIGPSGCGKSTFLKSLNRMHDETPEVRITGKIFVDGEDIYSSNVNVIDTRRKMGLLAQRPCPIRQCGLRSEDSWAKQAKGLKPDSHSIPSICRIMGRGKGQGAFTGNPAVYWAAAKTLPGKGTCD
jgi:hypothetical protein